jgi:hypothetical protein
MRAAMKERKKSDEYDAKHPAGTAEADIPDVEGSAMNGSDIKGGRNASTLFLNESCDEGTEEIDIRLQASLFIILHLTAS